MRGGLRYRFFLGFVRRLTLALLSEIVAVHDNDVISPMTTPSPPPPLLEARAVQKHFGRVVALREANFTLRPDEVHAIVGDNGAGKSTLIKIISGVYQA